MSASAHRKLNVRMHLDATGSLRPDASFVQGLLGRTIYRDGVPIVTLYFIERRFYHHMLYVMLLDVA